jgi:hypothetical protein
LDDDEDLEAASKCRDDWIAMWGFLGDFEETSEYFSASTDLRVCFGSVNSLTCTVASGLITGSLALHNLFFCGTFISIYLY